MRTRRGRIGALTLAGLALVAAGCSAGPAEVPVPTVGAPSSTESAGPVPAARGQLVVHGTGDVNLDPAYIPALRARGYDHAWSGLDGLFTRDSLTVVNMECPVSTRGSAVAAKEFTFRCDPGALPAAAAAGVDIANLANNHVRDYGEEAMLDSVTHVRDAGIAPVGVGRTAALAAVPAIVEKEGWRVAVVGFGGVVPDPAWLAGDDSAGMADGDDIASMVATVQAADEMADLVFVTLHWGVELDTEPRPDDVRRARAMIDAGADGVFGHHAHRLQPLEWYQDRPIAWGLGNFVWPTHSEPGRRSAVAEFVVRPDGSMAACLLPAYIASPGHPELREPYAGPCQDGPR